MTAPYAVHSFDGTLLSTHETSELAARALDRASCLVKDGAVLRWHTETPRPAQRLALAHLTEAGIVKPTPPLHPLDHANPDRPDGASAGIGIHRPRLSPMGDRFLRGLTKTGAAAVAVGDRDDKPENNSQHEEGSVKKTCKKLGCKKVLRAPRKGPVDPSVADFCFEHRPRTGAVKASAGDATCTAPGCSNAPGAESKRPELSPLCDPHRTRVWKHEDNAKRRGKPIPSIAEILAPGQRPGPRRAPVARTKSAGTKKAKPPPVKKHPRAVEVPPVDESDVASASALITRCLSAIARLGGIGRAEKLVDALGSSSP